MIMNAKTKLYEFIFKYICIIMRSYVRILSDELLLKCYVNSRFHYMYACVYVCFCMYPCIYAYSICVTDNSFLNIESKNCILPKCQYYKL